MPTELSVVIVTLEGPERLAACLDALKCQAGAPEFEIIVPWDGAHGSVDALRARFPAVRIPLLKGLRTPAELRAFGIASARGKIVAITEDHCTPREDWCARIVAAHQAPHAAIGGAVEKETPDNALNWSFYLADYLRYLDPAEGAAHHLTDCNVTYKRASLEAIRDIWQREFHENTVHDALRERGESLWIAPSIVVRQRRAFSLRSALWDRYAFGRLFGSTRAAQASTYQRATYLCACVLLPALLVWRVAGHVRRTRRDLGAFLRALPFLSLISAAWALGEFAGYLTGRPEERLSAARDEAAA